MVRRLMRHWTLFSMTNSTSDLPPFEDDWKGFLTNNSGFIEPLDFVRDMAVEDPGHSSVLFARYGQAVMKENTTAFLPFFGTGNSSLE